MATPLRLLIIEDSSDDAQLMARTIEHGGYDVQYERVETEAALESALRDHEWDLILSDYTMPSFNAVRALEVVQATGKDIPFIVVSGSIGEEMAIAALRGGAHDFILKGNLARLLPAIQRELSDHRTRIERQQAEAHYRTLVEQLPMIVYIGAAEDIERTIYVSPQVERILGFTAQEWLADPSFWITALHPDDRRRVLAEMQRANETGEPFDIDYRMIARDGHIVWFRDQATRMAEEAGGTLQWQGLMIDITATRQRQREWEAIARLSTSLRQAQTLAEIIPRLLDETLALMDSQQGSIWLQLPGSDVASVFEQRQWDRDHLGPYALSPVLPQEVISRGTTMVLRDLHEDPRIPEQERHAIPPGIGGAAVPLIAAGKTVGAIFVNIPLPREITLEEQRVLSALADLGAYAIHRAQLFDETAKHVDRLAALRSIDIAISSSFDIQMVLNVVLDNVIRELHVDAADVMLLRADSLRLDFGVGKGFWTQAVEADPITVGDGLPGRAVLQRDITHVPDLRELPGGVERPYLVTDEKFVSYFAVPLVAKGKVKGVLEIFHRSRLEQGREWLQFLEALAGQTAIAIDSSSVFQDLQRSNLELALAYDATIAGWSHALDLRDRETEGHTLRVTEMALKLARAMGMDDQALVHLRRGALLHDIGKMGIPDSILLKPGRLTNEEWAVMRRHPQFAYDMLANIPYLYPALDVPYSHHERWDGEGYPRGLKGSAIPLSARIFAVVDVWDALLNDRPYRPRRKPEDVLKYIEQGSGKHFDPAVVEAFIHLMAAEPAHLPVS